MEEITLKTVNYEQAHALYELGYPMKTVSVCRCHLEGIDASYIAPPKDCIAWSNDTGIEHPTLEAVAKWIRDNKGMFINVGLCCDYQYQVYLQTTLDKDHNIISEAYQFNNYDDALSTGINIAIDKLKSE